MLAGGIPPQRMRVVRSGVVQDTRTSSVDLRAELGIPPGAPVVGTIAALAPHKNHAQLLQTAKLLLADLPGVHFVWLGEGSERERLEAMRADLEPGGHVHMPGHRDDAVALLPQFDVFALSSSTEGLGTSLLDAALAGVPIVASRTGGIAEVVVDGVTGRLVEVGDVEGFARAIRETLEQTDAVARRVVAARDHARTFSAAAMAEGTLAAYRELTG